MKNQNVLPKNLDPDIVYGLLEEQFLTYQDLVSVPVLDCDEPLIDLDPSQISTHTYTTEIENTNDTGILVRQGIVPLLVRAQDWLDRNMPGYRLQVFYGYRSPEIQKKSFQKIAKSLGFFDTPTLEQLEIIHRFVAVPNVAGHPTGGAVDVTLIDASGRPLSMGTPPHAFEKNSYTFSPYIARNEWMNRQMLRAAMMSAGFAPFDGEWWHFSYGDREWARYWQKSNAIYGNRSP